MPSFQINMGQWESFMLNSSLRPNIIIFIALFCLLYVANQIQKGLQYFRYEVHCTDDQLHQHKQKPPWWRVSVRTAYSDAPFAKQRPSPQDAHPRGRSAARMASKVFTAQRPQEQKFPSQLCRSQECESVSSKIKATLQGPLRWESSPEPRARTELPSRLLQAAPSVSGESILLLSMIPVCTLGHVLNDLFLQITLCLDPKG